MHSKKETSLITLLSIGAVFVPAGIYFWSLNTYYLIIWYILWVLALNGWILFEGLQKKMNLAKLFRKMEFPLICWFVLCVIRIILQTCFWVPAESSLEESGDIFAFSVLDSIALTIYFFPIALLWCNHISKK